MLQDMFMLNVENSFVKFIKVIINFWKKIILKVSCNDNSYTHYWKNTLRKSIVVIIVIKIKLVILSVNYDSNIPSDSQQYPDKLWLMRIKWDIHNFEFKNGLFSMVVSL